MPDPCRQSQVASVIDAAQAHALGFGGLLDLLPSSFELPLEWTPLETFGSPASGYVPNTTLRGTTRVATMEHLTSTLDGCEYQLQIGVELMLETGDGALSLEGRIETRLARDTPAVRLYGGLDLMGALGTLELAPPDQEVPAVGLLRVEIYFRPSGVRSQMSIEMFESDPLGYSYRPLTGRAPVDACEVSDTSLAANAPIAAARGASVTDVNTELQALLASLQPIEANWAGGDATSVMLSIGPPVDACSSGVTLKYKVPLGLTSADGRLNIQHDANARLELATNGGLRRGSLEVPLLSSVVSREDFEANTGISGVDFGNARSATWYATMLLSLDPNLQMSGEIGVEGVEIDAGTANTTGMLESLGW